MKNRKGLTLVEIVISMALIGMVAVVFLTIFNTGNKNIFRSGNKTKEVYQIQESVDSQINSFSNLNLEGVELKELEGGVTIKIEGIPDETIKGNLITGEKNGIKIVTFVPYLAKDK